ncbi:MAG: spermidine/putrescine ABC transporter substrate-binding protein [Clostridia bacterium]
MKKILASILSLAMICTMFTACSSSSSTDDSSDTTDDTVVETTATPEPTEEPEEEEVDNNVLTLYTWEGMFSQDVLDGFEAETGYEINYVTFDTDETMLAKLQAAEGGDYDLVIADDYIIETAIAEGLVQTIDTSVISNYDNINEAYQGLFYDPTDEYTVPFGAGVMALVYDPSLVSIEIDSFEDLWDKSLQSNVGIVANYRVVNGITLLSMGESMNTEDVSVIEEAGVKLLELAPNIRVIKDSYLQDDLLSGEVGVALMYTSQTTQALLANPDLEVVFPTEGTGFGTMAMFIPSEAPNSVAALAFMDYVLDAEVGASCFEWLGYYSTNAAADEYIYEEYQAFLTLPDDFDASTLEMIENVSSEADEAHSKIWTAFKTAAE